LEEYSQYKLQGGPERLKRVQELSHDAANIEIDYREPTMLLSDLGVEYLEIGNYPEAEIIFNDVISVRPGHDAFLGLGNALFFQEKYEKAIEAYNKAI
jgi:tetratricopeptide (TPR) repeat protein